MTCETCKFWDRKNEHYAYGPCTDAKPDDAPDSWRGKFRLCLKIVHVNRYDTEAKMPLACTVDASGYQADCWTQPSFGCAMWQEVES